MSNAAEPIEVRIKGLNRLVPSIVVDGQRVIVTGNWLKVARVQDEDWLEGQIVRNPKSYLDAIREATDLRADLFTFCQKIPDVEPRYSYPFIWDNSAVIRTSNFEEWWSNLPQVTRKNVRRATRRGVVVSSVTCTHTLLSGITDIYNEIPIRDGRPFPHYGKDLAAIRSELSTMADRSEFLAAYCGEELVGFMKLIHMGKLTSILHIVSKHAHYDKRPANALLAKAVEVCQVRGACYLIYGQYTYGKRTNSQLTEFKRRNGFERVVFPRYFVPLTSTGRLSLRMGVHEGVARILPAWFVDRALRIRAKYYERRLAKFLSGRTSVADPLQQEGDC
jgi:hypothetical protein